MEKVGSWFEKFWEVWPRNLGKYSRKGGRSECREKWARFGCEEQGEFIVRHVEWLKTTDAWLRDEGQFIPAPLVYLNQQRWDGADIPEVKTQALNTTEMLKQQQERGYTAPPPELRLIANKFRRTA